MKHFLTSTAVALLLGTAPAFAGDNTAVGIGTGIAKSSSSSSAGATAIGGGNATGGNGVGAVILNPGAINAGTTNPANTNSTVTQQGHSSVTTVPTVFAPGLAAAGIETCLGSMSGGASWLGTGISLGGTTPDAECSARLDARTLWSFGLRKAAVSRLCLATDIQRAMPDVCGVYLPRPAYAPAYTPAYGYAQPASYGQTVNLQPGQIWLVNGRTHAEQICNDYDSAHKHCRRWLR